MSVKCKYSKKFEPLVLRWKERTNSKDEFVNTFSEYFTNDNNEAETIWVGGTIASNPVDPFSIENGNLMDNSLISNASNSRGMYVGNPEGFRQMEQQFITDIVSRILYDPQTGKWTDPTQKVEDSDFSFINTALFEYKVYLIEKLTGTNPGLDINSPNIQNELTAAINNALSQYNKTIKDSDKVDSNYQYYVILANFNSLLQDIAPFIEINDVYKNRKSHGVDMYNYIGPKATLRQNWDNGEIVGIQDQYSGLSKILLSVIPEVNKAKRVIPGTSIGSSGYAAVMSTLKSAFYFSNDEKIKALREKYFKNNGKLDLDELIDAYLTMIENPDSGISFKKDYKTFLTDKLRGIQKGIFHDENIPQNIKDMFARMFFETASLRYRTYGKSWKNSFGGMNLDDSWKNNQYYKIQDTLNAKVNSYIQNERRKNDLRATWNIEVDKDHVKFVLDKDHTLTIEIIDDGRGNLSFKAVEPEWTRYGHEQLPRLIYQMTGMYVTPEYIQRREMYNENLSYVNDFLGMLAISASIIFGDANNTLVNDNYDSDKQVIRYNRHNLFWSFDTAATIFAIVRGADTANVVKDINGNNLPTRGLTSLAYEIVEFQERFSKIGWSVYGKNNFIHRNNTHFGEPMIQEGIKGTTSNKKITGLSEVELYEKALAFDFLGELDEGTIYLQPTTNADKTKIFTLPVDIEGNFSISDGYDLNIKEQLNAIINGNRSKGVNAMELAMYRIRSNRYQQLERNILDRYNAVFEIPFNSIVELDQYLKENNIKYDDLYQAFLDNGQDFVDEVIAVKDKNGYAKMNETLVSKVSIYNEKQDSFGIRIAGADNFDQFQKKMDRCKRRFAWDLLNSGFKLNYYTSKGGKMMYERLITSNSKWVNDKTKDVYIARYRKKGYEGDWTYMTRTDRSNRNLLLDPSFEVEINPVMEAYFYVDDLITYDYNHASIGEEFAHKLKNPSGDPNKKDFDVSEYEEFCEAGRWIASVKRNVIPGASIHPFLQGKKDGVASEINVAVMEDIPADNWNFFLTHVDDSHDGSGLASIFEIMLEQNSLADAGTNSPDLKTIGWDLDPELGIPRMLKWAVYGLTNERRRLGALSSANVENLFKRMHNIKFTDDIEINVQDYFNKFNSDGNGFYFTNFETGITYHVTNVVNSTYGSYRIAYRMDGDQQTNDKVFLDSNNKEFDLRNISSAKLALNTIYDLDQFFGGAWCKKMNAEQKLVDSDYNTQVVFDIICDKNLKNNFIAYAVNKSAFKVGYTNVNKKQSWFNDDDLHTFKMSTRHIGLQMNADHELLDSEVTEMTQMISALSENWYAGEIVKQIYEDIGSVIEESLSSLNRDLADDLAKKGDKIRLRLGKALIESFDKEDDTIGLAQAFLDKARRILQDGGVPNIPFSAATINGKLIAEIASRLTKKGIRRKYDGIAAVLTPSFNMVSYFNYNRNTGEVDESNNPIMEQVTGLASEVASEIRNIIRTEHPELSGYRLRDLCHNAELPIYDEFGRYTGKVMLNPLVDEIFNKDDLQEGDTIIEETINPDGSIKREKITLDSWDRYNRYVNIGTNNRIYRMRYAPRDLKGANTSFMYNGKRRSALNFATVQAAHQVNAKIPSTELADLIIADSYFKSDIVGNFINGKWENINYQQTMRNIVQHQLEDLEKGIVHDRNFGLTTFTREDGITVEIVNNVTVTDVQVEAGECIMGKMNAEKFGLVEGDRIDQILKQGADFFYNRFKPKYGEYIDMDKDLYDGVIYTSEGPIFIHFGNFKNTEQLNKLSRNTHITQVDDDLVIGNYVLGKAENKTVYSYNTGQKQYDVICVNEDSLKELLNSEISDTIKWNVKRNNLRQIKTFLDPDNTKYGNIFTNALMEATSSDTIQILFNKQLAQEFESEQRNLAQRRFYAFKKSLEIVGARIPTQAMQSFMPMKIVAFTNSEHNDIYIPRSQTWLQGSDYDIDKVYCLGYSIAKNGTLPTLSELDKIFDVEEVLRLGKPNGKTYTQQKTGGFKVSLQELNAVTGDLKGIGTNGLPLFGADVTYPTGKPVLDIFRRIIQSGQTEITFEEPSTTNSGDQSFFKERNEVFNWARNTFMYLLNKHSHSKVTQNVEAALRNYVVQGINDVSRKPSVQINALSPIDMNEAQNAAKNSPLGQLEKHFSPEIPTSKWKLQEQALGGKDVVGIAAVSVKCFFAETTYFNTVLDDIANRFITANAQIDPNIKAQMNQQAFNMLKNLVMRNPLDGKWSLVANANVKKVLQKLNGIDTIVLSNYDSEFLNGYSAEEKKLWDPDSHTFELSKFLKMLDERANIIDAALSESGLLSSATDNMKELILPKLQATAAFVDIYTTLLATGVKFDDIAKIMTSSAFTEITRLVNANIFDISTDGYSLERAIDFFVNLKTLPHVKSGIIKDAFYTATKDNEKIQSMSQTEDSFGNSEWKTILSNSDLVKKALEKIHNQRKSVGENKYYGQDISDYLDDMFDGTAEENEEPWRNSLEDASIEDLNLAINFLEEVLIRNSFIKNLELRESKDNDYKKLIKEGKIKLISEQLSDLKKIKENVLPKTEEQRIFGMMLGINQGLKTDPFDMHKLIRNIENFVSRRVNNGEEFDLMRFLSDNEYQNKWIALYDDKKSSFNILHAIRRVPHFSKMFDVLYLNHELQQHLSAKTQIVEALARALERDNQYPIPDRPYNKILSEKEYKAVQNYVNEWFIIGWFNDQDLSFSFNDSSIGYYTEHDRSKLEQTVPIGKLISLNDPTGLANFKHWMEEEVIPMLKERYPDNTFIQHLEKGFSENKRTGKVMGSYRLPLNMMTIDESSFTQMIYTSYLNSFNEISLEYYGREGSQWTIGDLFFIYNLICNKDGFGQHSLTRIFENLVSAKKGTSIINSYYDYVAQLDKQFKEDRKSFINNMQSEGSDVLEDLATKIEFEVQNSSIKPKDKGLKKEYESQTEDFTFYTVKTSKDWRINKSRVLSSVRPKPKRTISITDRTIVQGIINNLISNYGESNVKVLNEQDYNELSGNNGSTGFIDKGVVYLKRDTGRLDYGTIAHEFAHAILAGLRFNTKQEYRDFYYRTIGLIDVEEAKQDSTLSKIINEYSKTKMGIDLKEEIFAKYLEGWLKNKINANSKVLLSIDENSDIIQDTINTLFGTHISNVEDLLLFTTSDLTEAINIFGSSLFNLNFNDITSRLRLETAQVVSALKKMLIDSNTWMYKCD